MPHPGEAAGGRLLVRERPASDALTDVTGVSAGIVAMVVRRVAPCARLPDDEIRSDVMAFARHCVGFAAAALDDPHSGDQHAALVVAGARWAREGMPIEAIHHAIYAGVQVLVELIAAAAGPADTDALRAVAGRLVAASETVSNAVSDGYLDETRAMASEKHTDSQALASALLTGGRAAMTARQRGITLAPAYFIVTLMFPAGSSTTVRAELRRTTDEALALLARGGGIVLLSTAFGERRLDALLARLSDAAESELTAIVMDAPTADIPDVYRHVRELFDLVRRTRRGPGIYRLPDLVIDYQLARPGPARRSLHALLDPLRGRPELVDTLRVYLDCELNRKLAARKLYIHPNTLRRRFRRIDELTGLDPSDHADMWYFRGALVALAPSGTG